MPLTESPPPAAADSVDALIAAVADRLRDASAALSDRERQALAEEIVLDSMRFALAWTEEAASPATGTARGTR